MDIHVELSMGHGRFDLGWLRRKAPRIGHRHVARPEPDNTFWTDSTNEIQANLAQTD